MNPRPSFGYTDREWAFLELAATWSGYFVPRQFGQFIGGSPGAVTQVFVQKLLSNRHASLSIHARNVHLYHLSARPLYAALRQENNRHRRLRPAHQVRTKLMVLDFVLARREECFLSSEREKLEHFLKAGINPETLPKRSYAGKNDTPTVRYFLDKFPVLRSGEETVFTFVTGDSPSRSPFLTYLDGYWRLFSALGTARLVYVTSRETLAAAAEADLASYMERHRATEPAGLRDFFFLRRRHENGGPELSIEELRTLRAAIQKYAGSSYEALYRSFLSGAQTDLPEGRLGPEISFETALLPHRYDLFGDLRG